MAAKASLEPMASEIEHLRELLDERVDALRRELLLRDEARDIAKIEIDRRLTQMNEFRAQLEKERGAYLTRDLYDREHGVLEKRVAALEVAKGGISGGWLVGGAFVSVGVLIVAILTVVVLYFKHSG